MKNILLSVICVILFASCSPTFSYKKLVHIQKNMTYTQVTEIMNINFGSNHEKDLMLYYINNSKDDTHDIKLKSGEPVKVLITYKNALKKQFYIFAFKNDRLIYWGFPADFNMSRNVELQEIGEAASDIITNEYMNKES